MRHLLAAAAIALALPAAAQTVTFNGSMGDKALLVIDGQVRTVAVGATVMGVKLLSLSGDEAKVDVAGRTLQLRHGAPVNMGGAGAGGQGNVIVMSAGIGGHFTGTGTINGKAMRFVVDTGATFVAIGQGDAQRMGLNYKAGELGYASTANGVVQTWKLSLNSVRIGDVEVYNVDAMVMPSSMPYVLLGNSFLSRFQMKRDNDTLKLEKR